MSAASAHRSTSSDELKTLASSFSTFLQRNAPRFTPEIALDVIRQLQPHFAEGIKPLAKRLRAALHERRVSIKHTVALEATARILGHTSWHASNREAPEPTLKLSTLTQGPEEFFSDWHALTPRLCHWCKVWHQARGVKVFEIQWGADFVLISIAVPKEGAAHGETDRLPILAINPIGDPNDWLDDALATFETLRRHLEESGLAVLDGFAVLQLCGRKSNRDLARAGLVSQPVTPTDACDSELILSREDNELRPGEGYEIGRGDEMTCWSQLELALKGQPLDVQLDEEAWRVADGRYIWQLATLHPGDYVPGLVHSGLNPLESQKLLARYRLAKRILAGPIAHPVVTKRLRYLSGPEDTYRVDLHRVFHALHDAGLDWDSFCKAEGLEQPRVPEVPIGFVITLAERLKLKDPNKLFARPARPQLVLVRDDALLRSFLPRIDFVRYHLSVGLSVEEETQVRESVADFGASLRVQKMRLVNKDNDPDPLPYLVFASDAEELRLRLDSLGLVMYIGVMPHLVSTEGLIEKLPNVCPYAFGHTLYLDIDRREEVTA